uniref:Asparagine synthetase domain-containing protein n=1 Tax=Globisporangium ultimum (strain ATCC 200006 / CBS 805.95 / DAOM BR144) TaxID=431595 RepID=K3WWW8_GLOUD
MALSKRLVARLKAALAPKGFDVVIPLTLESYNRFLDVHSGSAASDLSRFKLPAPSNAAVPLQSHLLVLVGNSRAIWTPFLEFVREEMEQAGDGGTSIQANPIDRYVEKSIQDTIEELSGDDSLLAPEKVYWVADTDPKKMILAQKMALAAHAVSHCPPSQLCLHPVFGPWLAFRCALLFAVEGLDNEYEPTSEQQAPTCSHDGKMHEEIATMMERAFAQARANGQSISPDAWKAWVLPRITMAPNHPMTYSSEQILYHYTKDLAFLAQVVHAQQHNCCTDYLRIAPSEKVVACRQLLQTVLLECKAKYPSGIDGILLSGGLDTSIIAEASGQVWNTEGSTAVGKLSLDKRSGARPILQFKHALTVQAHPDARDALYAQNIYERLHGVSLEHHHVLQANLDELLCHAPQATKLLVTCDPMELRNSLVIYAALTKAAELGVKHVVTGDAADEIFCGYSFYQSMDEDALMAYRLQIINVMQFTASKLARAFDIEVISPFLDPRVVEFAKTVAKDDLIGERTPVPIEGASVLYGKLILRQAFPESFSQWRSKQPIEEGSGTTALRMGYFDTRWAKSEFEAQQKTIFQKHRVFVRDNEHLFFFQAFLEAFGQDLANVPKQRTRSIATQVDEDETIDDGFCPACFFELSHKDQDFCVTCGFWPTKPTTTNDVKGYATQALARLAQDKRRLLSS